MNIVALESHYIYPDSQKKSNCRLQGLIFITHVCTSLQLTKLEISENLQSLTTQKLYLYPARTQISQSLVQHVQPDLSAMCYTAFVSKKGRYAICPQKYIILSARILSKVLSPRFLILYTIYIIEVRMKAVLIKPYQKHSLVNDGSYTNVF